MRTLVETDHAVMSEHDGVLIVRRTATPYKTVDEFAASIAKLFAAVDKEEHTFAGLIIDTRDVRGRNDDDFEMAAVELQRQALKRLPRMVVLMKSQVGMLQGQRLLKGQDRCLVTADEVAAFRFIREGE